MQIDIHVSGLSLSAALRENVERRARFSLSRIAGRVRRVEVHLADINGPRGGLDKHCRVQVHLISAPLVLIEEIDDDVYHVLERAFMRAGRAAVRRIERSQQFGRPASAWSGEEKLGQIRDLRRRLPLLRKSLPSE